MVFSYTLPALSLKLGCHTRPVRFPPYLSYVIHSPASLLSRGVIQGSVQSYAQLVECSE